MKFCTTCGEVYSSNALACSADGSTLEAWTRRAFVPSDAADLEAKTDLQLVPRQAGMARGKGHHQPEPNAMVDEITTVQATAVRRVGSPGSARGKRQHLTDVGSDIGEHTDVVEIGQPATLPEFDASAPNIPAQNSGNLVVYDQEESEPFEGMLIGNRYCLKSRIGTGGFGVVFDAIEKDTNKRVAIKILSPALSQDRRALARFRREAIAASRINHPGIIEIADFGIEDDGVSYIVMEYLPGRDLAALLESEGRLAPKRAAALIAQCAEALSAAHHAGVLHRDLKPANIFVINDAGGERVKIIDFGIAKDQSSNPRTADLTSASKVVGTPYYMSPEQARGHDLDGRADVYSLGIILFELLTGVRPFEAPSVLEILMAHSKAARVRPSSLCPELASEIDLEKAVLLAIQAKAKLRFADMSSLADALRSYLAGPSPALSSHRALASKQVAAVPAAANDDLQIADEPLAHLPGLRAGSADVTRRQRLYLGGLTLPLWTALVPASALVLAFLLIRSGEGHSQATNDSPVPTTPAKAIAAPSPAPKASVEEPSPQDDPTMEFDSAEDEIFEMTTAPTRETRSASRTHKASVAKQNGRKAAADDSSDRDKSSVRRNTRKSQAIAEW